MALAAVRAIEEQTSKLLPYASQLPAWAVYKVTRARQRLSDAVFYARHATPPRQRNEGEPGHMAARELAQLWDDAHWLAESITPMTRLPEWVESYITQAHVDIHDVYAAVIRSEGNPISVGGTVRAQGLSRLLVHLRALYQLHQDAHWQTQGPAFYGDHLLFQRLYEETQELTDAMAERLMGLEGPATMQAPEQAAAQAQALVNWQSVSGLPERSLAGVQATLAAYQEVSRELQAAGEQTLGLEDLIPAQASALETHAYLLKQRVGRATASVARNNRGQPRAPMG